MIHSLRARLIAGLLTLTAVGLLVAGGVTYAEQRSFLYNRADQQAQSAADVVSHRFATNDGTVTLVPLFGSGVTGGTAVAPPPPASGFGEGGRPNGSDGTGGSAGRPPDDGGHGQVDVPGNSYGEVRSATGKVLINRSLGFGQSTTSPPKLPAKITPGRLFTVNAEDGSLRYRVYARAAPGGDLSIAAIPLHDVDQTLNRLLLVEGLVIAGVLAALGLFAWLFVRSSLRPLDRMGETAGAIAGGELSRRVSPANARSEVGRLGLALNNMLDRLERAFAERKASEDRLRTFLSDASHELRTPLASIRGYAEVFRMGAAADPADTAKAMRRIEDEAARMGVLVEDLLVLARLDELRKIERTPVDLAQLAHDAADDARVVAPDRTITVDAQDDSTVDGDEHDLRKVLSNLVRNALVHTPPGTPIDVGVARDNGTVRLTVRDHGPGLPASAGDRLFGRFWRAEAGRERGKGGAGLGLAIVAEVARGHGGAATAENAADGGARFTVELPAADAADKHS